MTGQLAAFELQHAKNFMDAGDTVVALVYGFSFALFYMIAKEVNIRELLVQNTAVFLGLQLVGTIALTVLLWRFTVNELLLINDVFGFKCECDVLGNHKVTSKIANGVCSAYDLRVIMIWVNYGIVLFVAGFIKFKAKKNG